VCLLIRNSYFAYFKVLQEYGGKAVVKLRLQRVGTKKKPFYRVVAVDERRKRDGAVIDFVGRYQPIIDGDQFTVDEEKVLSWLKQGAQPTATVLRHLKKNGIWNKFRAAQ
jgi:small subunit ribosomal protein S16